MADRLLESQTDTMNDSKTAPASDSIRSGRRAPTFVMTPEWVIVSGLSSQAQALYTALLAHVNRNRGDGVAWPGMDVLAELLGYRTRKSIARYLAELVDIGAVDVERQAAMIRRNVYVVHEVAPEGYAGPMSLAEFYAARRARRGTSVPLARGLSVPVARGTERDVNHTNATTRSDPDEATSSDAASGAHRASSPGDRKIVIHLPRDFDKLTDGRAQQHLVKASVTALRAVGMEPAPDAADRLGHALKCTAESKTRAELVSILEYTLGLAGTDNPTWGSLAREDGGLIRAHRRNS